MFNKKKKVLLIIPAYNEEENIKLDFIVIKDESKDNTKKFLEENNIPHINSIHNLGIGGAVWTGYKYALKNNYDSAIQFYGYGQHDVRYAEKIIKPIVDGKADFTIGSRFIEELSRFKSFNVRGFGINIIVTRINGIDESGLFSFYYSLSFTLHAIVNYGGRIY